MHTETMETQPLDAVERVARECYRLDPDFAIAHSKYEQRKERITPLPWVAIDADEKRYWLSLAKAAIAAIPLRSAGLSDAEGQEESPSLASGSAIELGVEVPGAAPDSLIAKLTDLKTDYINVDKSGSAEDALEEAIAIIRQESANRPLRAWTCFHCGETFTKTGAALDHFGDNPLRTPGCIAKVEVGHERDWLIHVRKLEKARDDLAVLHSAEYAEPARAWPKDMLVSRHSDYEKMEKIVEDLVKDLPLPRSQSSEIPVVDTKGLFAALREMIKEHSYVADWRGEHVVEFDIADGDLMRAIQPYLREPKRESGDPKTKREAIEKILKTASKLFHDSQQWWFENMIFEDENSPILIEWVLDEITKIEDGSANG